MNCITIRFYGELNDFLHTNQRQTAFQHCFKEQPSIKDVIESLGVPHTEIDLLLIDGQSADFSQQLHGGELVTVYPVFKNIDISEITKVRPKPLTPFRFVLDVHLGKLASYLRMAGFDTLYSNHAAQDQLVDCAFTEKRILLTFNRELLKRKKVVYGYHVRSRSPVLQLTEVLKRFELLDHMNPFTRCMSCNSHLARVSKDDVLFSIPDMVRESLDEFWQCHGCGQVYWKGTHYMQMKDFIDELRCSMRQSKK